MKNSLSSIPTQRIARGLVLTFAATAACTFFSACFGTAYRHDARVENRVDRRVGAPIRALELLIPASRILPISQSEEFGLEHVRVHRH